MLEGYTMVNLYIICVTHINKLYQQDIVYKRIKFARTVNKLKLKQVGKIKYGQLLDLLPLNYQHEIELTTTNIIKKY